MVHKEAAFFQLFSNPAANTTPACGDQLSHSTADESWWLLSHLGNSPRANILNVSVQIRLSIARIPNGTGKVHTAHIMENRPGYCQVLPCELV